VITIAIAFGPGARLGAAIEVPPAGGFYFQTSGPNTAVTIGDWYTATSAGSGAGYHYLEVTIPCGWPASTPIHFDLFSPEMNNVAGSLGIGDEVRGSYDSTQFELYGPGATVGPGYANPSPGAGIAGTQTTYPPGAPAVAEAWTRWVTLSPVSCGRYLVRSAVLVAPDGDDDNGWRLRVGSDNDGDPNNAPPANSDNPDGIAGTNDEVIVGQVQISYQHSTGGVACLTLYQYIPAGLASVTMNNFDMDGNTRVTYYAPSDAFDPTGLTGGTTGTLSVNGQWNQGTIARGGDVLTNPEPGWWRVVSCLGATNQFIQEAQAGIGAYFGQPPIPTLAAFKSDGATQAAPGETLTYSVTVLNTASGPTAGAALQVVVSDVLPAGVTFTGCTIVAPATGTCSESAGVVTANLNNWINAGAGAMIQITVTVNANATGTLADIATVSYEDVLGNPFPDVTAADSDTVVVPPTLPNTAMAGGPFEALALAALLLVGIAILADVNLSSNRRRARV
jgi:uncharacterized repeat protein (TIGR01451 family)